MKEPKQMNNNNIKRICPMCGQQFVATRASTVYCDIDCFMASQPPPPEETNVIDLAKALMQSLSDKWPTTTRNNKQ